MEPTRVNAGDDDLTVHPPVTPWPRTTAAEDAAPNRLGWPAALVWLGFFATIVAVTWIITAH